MLRKLFGSPPARTTTVAAIPEGRRVYAIGDIHGCADLLDRLLELVDADDAYRDPAETTLIFLGDLVDRGPDSAGVIDRLIAFRTKRPGTRFIMGNHEEILLAALDGDPKAIRLFCRIGGRETALSYGIEPALYERCDYDELLDLIRQTIPPAHVDFLRSFENLIEIGDYAFVHAGVRPDRPLADQRPADLRWIRDPFLDHGRPLSRLIVHGHTIADDIMVEPHRIGIDTGAYASGRLSALALEGDRFWPIQTD